MKLRGLIRSLVAPAVTTSILALLVAAAAGPALAVDYASPSPAAAAVPASLHLGSGSSASLGSFLIGPNGMTLYTLSSDPSGGSACTGGCLAVWPPLLVAPGGPVTGPVGATATFSTFTRADDGSTQVTYNGRPLYYFVHDTAAGQTNGQGIKALGGVWLVAALSGGPSAIQLGKGTNSALGTFLTGAGGMTLYTLSSDPDNGTVCNGGCLTNWPPLLIAAGGSTSGPAGGAGTFGRFVRSDGTVQVTQDSRPLYYFIHDTAAGQTNGEGIAALGGFWHVAGEVLAATGTPAPTARPASGATPPPTDTIGNGTGETTSFPPALLLAFLSASVAALGALGIVAHRRRRA